MKDVHSVIAIDAEKEANNLKKRSLDATAQQDMITYLFVTKDQGLTNLRGKQEEKWNGRDGMIANNGKDLGCLVNFKTYSIENVLIEVVLCYTNGTKFDPKSVENRSGKRPSTFIFDSEEADIIDDSIKARLSMRKALFLVNGHLEEDMGDEDKFVNLSSIISGVKGLSRNLNKFEKGNKEAAIQMCLDQELKCSKSSN